jgi:hypothetical protein
VLAVLAIAPLMYGGNAFAEPMAANEEGAARVLPAPPGVRVFQAEDYEALTADPTKRRPQQSYQVETPGRLDHDRKLR